MEVTSATTAKSLMEHRPFSLTNFRYSIGFQADPSEVYLS